MPRFLTSNDPPATAVRSRWRLAARSDWADPGHLGPGTWLIFAALALEARADTLARLNHLAPGALIAFVAALTLARRLAPSRA